MSSHSFPTRRSSDLVAGVPAPIPLPVSTARFALMRVASLPSSRVAPSALRDSVPAAVTGATVIALPMKIAGGSGGPVRVVALLAP